MKDTNDPGTIDLVGMVHAIFGLSATVSPLEAAEAAQAEVAKYDPDVEAPEGPCWGVEQETRR